MKSDLKDKMRHKMWIHILLNNLYYNTCVICITIQVLLLAQDFKKLWESSKILTVYYHVTFAFQSESSLYSCLNVKELLAGNRCDSWHLNDSNGIQTHNHLVCKWTLDQLSGCRLWVRIPWLSVKFYPEKSEFKVLVRSNN